MRLDRVSKARSVAPRTSLGSLTPAGGLGDSVPQPVLTQPQFFPLEHVARPSVAIIGAGPAGLLAAELLAARHAVTIYDHMPSPGRKFLLAGRGGLNLTHTEQRPDFLARYDAAAPFMTAALDAFSPAALRGWCEGLGQPVFVGSSGRVFPTAFKAAPLLRAWLRRLDDLGVRFAGRHRWTGWAQPGVLLFETADGTVAARPDAVLLALGGASWPRMGSDGGWVPVLQDVGVRVAKLQPSNCGVDVAWSPSFLDRFEGQPLKRVALSAGGRRVRGEAVVTRAGLEGGCVYGLSAPIRDGLEGTGGAALLVDLLPDVSAEALAARVDGERRGRSLSNHLRQAAGLSPVAVGLVREALHGAAPAARLSSLIKSVPLRVTALQPIARAISSAGGIGLQELDGGLMIRRLPGVFAAGEMLDWEAPTGGYLLQGCFSTGAAAARGIAAWLGQASAASARYSAA